MARLIKNSFGNFLIILLIFVLMAGWFYSGWPQILEEPPVPPQTQEVQAAAGDVILLWDTANNPIPAGWDCISCADLATNTFYSAFPRASSTFGATKVGSDTHTHTIAYQSATQGSTDGTAQGDAGAKVTVNTHTHTWDNLNDAGGDHRPPFKNLNFIYANAPTELPANIIGIFDQAPPVNWTRYNGLDDKYLRGYSDNSTGGSATHTHSVSLADSGVSGETLADSGKDGSGADDHQHPIPATNLATSAQNVVPYLEVVFAYNSSGGDISITDGLIAMFDASPPANWTTISDSAPWNGNFLMGSTTYDNATGGGAAVAHDHGGSQTFTSGACDSSQSVFGLTGASISGGTAHTHDATYTITSEGPFLPVYRDVIFAKYSAPGVSCTTPVDGGTMTFDTIDNTAIYNSTPTASTTVTSSGSVYMKMYDLGSTNDPGFWKNPDLIESPTAANPINATDTIVIGAEGYGLQATTSGGNLLINTRYDFASSSSNVVGGLCTSTFSKVVASSSVAVASEVVYWDLKAAAAVSTPAGSYQDTLTITCTDTP